MSGEAMILSTENPAHVARRQVDPSLSTAKRMAAAMPVAARTRPDAESTFHNGRTGLRKKKRRARRCERGNAEYGHECNRVPEPVHAARGPSSGSARARNAQGDRRGRNKEAHTHLRPG
jgi:hypothetical protein